MDGDSPSLLFLFIYQNGMEGRKKSFHLKTGKGRRGRRGL